VLVRKRIALLPDAGPRGLRDDEGVAQTVDLENASAVRKALDIADSLGVLTVYLDARDAAVPGSAAIHALRLELRRLHHVVRTTWVADERRAGEHLAEVERRVDAAVLSGEARNLALFVALGSGTSFAVEPAGTVPTRAFLGVRADVRPLCLAVQAAKAAGVVIVSPEGARAFEWVPGELREIWSDRMPELEGRDLVGPSHAHPHGLPGTAPGFEVGQQRDLFERRLDDEYARFITAAGAAVAALAVDRGWEDVALNGDEDLCSAFSRGAPSAVALEIVPIPHLEQWRSTGQLALLVTPWIEGAREKRAEQLLRQLEDEAGPGGHATIGLGETLTALADGRVRRLVVHAEKPIVGRSSPDGVLAAPGDIPPGTSESALVDDVQLADSMIARALDTGAEVIVVPAATAAGTLLEELDVAALTRW